MKILFWTGMLVFLGFVSVSVACDCGKNLSLVESCPQCQKQAVRERIIEREVMAVKVRDRQGILTRLGNRLDTRLETRSAIRSSLHSSCSGSQTLLLQTNGCSCSGH